MDDAGDLRIDGRLERGRITREKVLDAAERLFAERGFDGVSIRDIAGEAGVTLALVGFHMGSKEKLFLEVLARRADELNALRMQALDEVETRRRKTRLRDIIAAMVLPCIEKMSNGDPQWSAYGRLLSYASSDERWIPVNTKLFEGIGQRVTGLFREIYPDADELRIASAYMLCISSIWKMANTRTRVEALAGRRRGSTKPQEYQDFLVDFISGGVHAALQASD